MTAHPIWFGGDEPLSGWLHLPEDDKARGGAVLCPTIGLEAMTAYPAYRQVAEALAAEGVAVLRFDYRGTGDSAGRLADASVEGWIEDVDRARAHLEACGVEHVALIGLRLGATIAAASAARHQPDALVLWDPVSSGRSFVREQQALKAFALSDSPAPYGDGVELAALVLPDALVGELRRLTMRGLALGGGAPCLLLERRARPADPLVEAYLEGAAAERQSVEGQETFIDIEPGSAALPGPTMAAVGSWVAGRFADRGGAPVEVLGTSEVTIAARRGGSVTERAVVFGEPPAFGIVTEPPGGGRGPAIVLSSLGALPHTGPGRLWVELARFLAANGRRVLRFDLRGLGDSPARLGRTPGIAYPDHGVADVLEAAAIASPSDPRQVVLVGICSGAYHSVEAARTLRPSGIAVVNPVFSLVPAELRDPAGPVADSPAPAPPPPNRVLQWMRRNELVVRLAKLRRLDAIRRDPRLARILDDNLPERVWRLLMRAGLAAGPAQGLPALVDDGTDVLLVCGRFEVRPYRRCRAMVERLAATGRFRLEAIEWIDHSLFGAAAAERVWGLLIDHLEDRFPVLSATGELPPPARGVCEGCGTREPPAGSPRAAAAGPRS